MAGTSTSRARTGAVLLGHTLSLIVVKSQVARGLAAGDAPARARPVGARALAEIREAVAECSARRRGRELSSVAHAACCGRLRRERSGRARTPHPRTSAAVLELA